MKQLSVNRSKLEWVAASFVFCAVICHAFHVYPLGPMLHLTGASIWVYTGIKKKNGPVLLNFSPQIPIWISGLAVYFLSR